MYEASNLSGKNCYLVLSNMPWKSHIPGNLKLFVVSKCHWKLMRAIQYDITKDYSYFTLHWWMLWIGYVSKLLVKSVNYTNPWVLSWGRAIRVQLEWHHHCASLSLLSTVMYRFSALCPSPPKSELNRYNPLNQFVPIKVYLNLK